MGRYYSDELEKGVMLLYFQRDPEKYAEGVSLIEQAVEKEEPDAFYFLARCYAWGDGNVESDDDKAIELSRRGIELGSDLCVLGADRFGGLRGALEAAMHHSLAESFEAVKRQAEAGDPMAQYAVGLFYYWQDISALQRPSSQAEYDRNEIENSKEAHKWFRMAARCGCLPAFRNVYYSFANGGNGVQKNIQAALAFAEEAKDWVDLTGEFCRSVSIEYKELNNPQRRIAWLERAADRGEGRCMNTLGVLYAEGKEGLPVDERKAFSYYLKAAEAGNTDGMYNVAMKYKDGIGTQQDGAKAFHYFQMGAEKGDYDCLYHVSRYYFTGEWGVPQDYAECLRVSKQAAEAGSNRAKYHIGYCYLYGKGCEINYSVALQNLKECVAKADIPDAYRCLAEIYDRGLGVSADAQAAAENYEKAAAKGSIEAKERLEQGFKKNLFGKWKRR